MTGFQNIKKVIIPKENLEMIYEHLRNAGKDGMEGIGLLLGRIEEETFYVTSSVIPNQKAYRTPTGLLYHVGGEELHEINMWAYKNKLMLFAQMHSHPKEAYHSETDDNYPIVTSVGGFSIVVPDFAAGPIDLNLWQVYRLTQNEGWKHIPTESLSTLFHFT